MSLFFSCIVIRHGLLLLIIKTLDYLITAPFTTIMTNVLAKVL